MITSVERVFDFTVAEDVATAFLKGEPAVTGYERHHRPWGHTDARRTVYFGDDSVREQINFILRPYVFDFQLTHFCGDLNELCDLAVNQFPFQPVGPRTLLKFYYQFCARDTGSVVQRQTFARDTWLS